MRRRDPGVVQVELLEGDATFAADGAVDRAAPDGDPRATARSRRFRWVGLAVMVTLVGTIVVATVVDTRRDAARRAALAELGWVLPPIEGPLEEVWRSSGGWVMGTTDDSILIQDVSGVGIRALDVSTGEVLWERDGAARESCFPLYDYRTVRIRYPTSAAIVCTPIHVYAIGVLPDPGFSARLVIIDAGTGVELGSFSIGGPVLVQDSVDDDLLLTYLDAEAAIGVVRWDPRSGEVWTYRSPPGLLPDGVLWTADAGGWRYALGEDVLRLTDDLALDLRTGREVAVPTNDPGFHFDAFVQELADGGRAEWRLGDGDYALSTRGRVLNADGSVRFEFEGEPWSPDVTDGSIPEAILTRSFAAVTAIDPASGAPLWTARGIADGWPAFALEGVVVVVGQSAVTALDARDGGILWQVDTGWAPNYAPPTDGDLVLVQVFELREYSIVAIDLRTGEEAWRMPGGGSGFGWDLAQAGGHFVLISDSNVIGLG